VKCSYFCAQHAAQIQQNEEQALHYWNQLMQMGVQHYIHCRLDQANAFLNSALELALLRFECQHNQFFQNLQLCKPLEFVMQLLLTEERYDEASLLLAKINNIVCNGNCNQALLDSIGQQYRLLESSERNYLLGDERKVQTLQ
jgi:hypothetical protein